MSEESPFGFKSSDDSTGFLLWRVHNYWQRELRKRLKKFDLTHTQFVVLATTEYLNISHEEVTQIDVAAHSGIDVMLTSNVLRALEKKGLISREAHSADTRAKKVFLTPNGLDLLKLSVKEVESFDQSFFSKIDNLEHFNSGLRILLNSEVMD